MNNTPLFHLAFPVFNLEKTREFYTKVLDCKVGRTSNKWIDFNFFGHQITAHLDKNQIVKNDISSEVDGKNVPIRHFGLIMDTDSWKCLVDQLIDRDVKFFIKPQTRFEGSSGEQSTFFIMDPFNNALEFKAFENDEQIFSTENS